jgi:GDP-4-dehydro-6-deoxy-D-mannose reductase
LSDALRRTSADVGLTGLRERSVMELPGVDELICADLSDAARLRDRLAARPPFDVCIHLAGVTGGASPSALYRTNVAGTANLIEVLGAGQAHGRLVVVSSCAVYGRAGETGEADESTPLVPVTAYGESCVAREMVARLLVSGCGLELVILRLFNLVGPGQPDAMMIPAIARQIARIEKGRQSPTLTVGRLDTARDYVDVRDAASALASIALRPGPFPGVMNLGSGTARSGAEVLDLLLGLTDVRPEVASRPDPIRASDVMRIRDTSILARTRIPWRPSFGFVDSLRDTLEDWRNREPPDVQ